MASANDGLGLVHIDDKVWIVLIDKQRMAIVRFVLGKVGLVNFVCRVLALPLVLVDAPVVLLVFDRLCCNELLINDFAAALTVLVIVMISNIF